MRAMKEDGIIITGKDIAYASPVRRSEDSSEYEDDQPVSEDKDTVGTEVASVSQDVRGKQPMVSGATTAAVPRKKKAGKEKLEVVEKEKEKEKEKRKRIAVSESERVMKFLARSVQNFYAVIRSSKQ
ncbi:hypothetical protein A2U01_0038679, partial [Trifolium medium]|nr:hypothetical protein [Trifolium medium]